MNQQLKQHINNINKGIIPKGYKKTKLGIIPEEWDVHSISEIGTVYSGGTPDTTKSEYWNGKIDWCTPTDITALKGEKYLTRTDRKISEQGLKKSSANLLPVNSLIVCTRATIGDCAINTIPMSTNQGFKNIVPNSAKSKLEYLYYFIVTSKQKLKRLGNGSTFLEISKKDFDKIKIPLPPLPEQQKIANILTTWDKAIELKEQLIEQKQAQKKGFMQNLLTGKVRIDGFEEEWKEVKVIDISTLGRGRVISKQEIQKTLGKYPVYSSQTVNEGKMGEISTYDFDGEYITWTTDGVNAGTVYYRKGKFNCTNVCGTIKLFEGYDHSFVAYLLSRETFKYVSHTLANPKLMNGEMAKIKIKVPSYNEQISISNVVQTVDSEINLFIKELESLKEQKKGLMQLLLTGKVRVKV